MPPQKPQKQKTVPEKELAELESKVVFLTDKNTFDLSLNEVAASMDVGAANLKGYLARTKDISLQLAQTLLSKLNKEYKGKLKKWKLERDSDSTSPKTGSVKHTLADMQVQLQALKELFFEEAARTSGMPLAEWHKKFEEKVIAIKSQIDPS